MLYLVVWDLGVEGIGAISGGMGPRGGRYRC